MPGLRQEDCTPRGRAMTLMRRQVLQLAGGAFAACLAPQRARAQTYPSRPVRVIVTTGPGGQGDTTARLVAAKLTESLGQSFYIENMPGGGGNIAMAATARAAPDGYTLVAAFSGGSSVDPSQKRQRVGRIGEGRPGEIQLRLGGSRHTRAPCRRIV